MATTTSLDTCPNKVRVKDQTLNAKREARKWNGQGSPRWTTEMG